MIWAISIICVYVYIYISNRGVPYIYICVYKSLHKQPFLLVIYDQRVHGWKDLKAPERELQLKLFPSKFLHFLHHALAYTNLLREYDHIYILYIYMYMLLPGISFSTVSMSVALSVEMHLSLAHRFITGSHRFINKVARHLWNISIYHGWYTCLVDTMVDDTCWNISSEFLLHIHYTLSWR